ncbi:MAG: NAD(P)/FAD-dependent oxidoreductase [Burkholderiaceae bacterium]|nr:NAD(P)/FAD-dependent oxidoreductase [Burkholderiaceae bacterium]
MTEQIVIVGGGAGGLELACKLGRKLGRGSGRDRVTLVDRQLFHVWKPSLHEVAAGTLDIHQEGMSYEMLAHDNGFRFVFGAMTGLDAVAREVSVAAVHDEAGEVLVPPRQVPYDVLVISVGSASNHFGVPGAAERTVSLDSPADAERFRMAMLKLLTSAELRRSAGADVGVDIVIIGAGATGVELAAELREASVVHSHYGFRRIDPVRDVRITLLEGADRILAPLPEKVSVAAATLLRERQVRIETGCQVTGITESEVADAQGRRFPADLVVWAAGIKAPEFLSSLGLPTARNGAIEVGPDLRVRGHDSIFALGDCAFCLSGDGTPVPPRAQAAHQQASFLYKALVRRAGGDRGAPHGRYVYRDYGSLVSIGTRDSVGNLMGNLFRSTWYVQGLVARLMYASLHLMHHRAVLGTVRTGVLAIARFLVRRARPQVKLH